MSKAAEIQFQIDMDSGNTIFDFEKWKGTKFISYSTSTMLRFCLSPVATKEVWNNSQIKVINKKSGALVRTINFDLKEDEYIYAIIDKNISTNLLKHNLDFCFPKGIKITCVIFG